MVEHTNTEDDEDFSLIDSVDFNEHTFTTDFIMDEIMEPLFDREMNDFCYSNSTSNQNNGSISESGIF